jgi:hypothetical protein
MPVIQSVTIKIIGIVGSRRRDTQEDYDKLKRILDSIYSPNDWFISGGCYKGADRMAEDIAYVRSIPIIIYEADWDKYGKAAGPIRNEYIARDCDVLIALPAQDRTGGTESTIYHANRFGKKVILT